MRPTIRDVAQRAGVSIATVSRALRDSGSVRKDTRARVLEAAEELQFTPSRLGRQLAERVARCTYRPRLPRSLLGNAK